MIEPAPTRVSAEFRGGDAGFPVSLPLGIVIFNHLPDGPAGKRFSGNIVLETGRILPLTGQLPVLPQIQNMAGKTHKFKISV
jgi:hypothetical protein